MRTLKVVKGNGGSDDPFGQLIDALVERYTRGERYAWHLVLLVEKNGNVAIETNLKTSHVITLMEETKLRLLIPGVCQDG